MIFCDGQRTGQMHLQTDEWTDLKLVEMITYYVDLHFNTKKSERGISNFEVLSSSDRRGGNFIKN